MAASLPQLAELFTALATQLDAGIPIHEALDSHAKIRRPGRLRQALEQWRDGVAGGGTWSQSVRASGSYLPPGTADILEAGESTGRLSQCCKLLAEDFEQRTTLSRALMALTWYPLLVLCFALGLGCLMAFLNPFGSMSKALKNEPKNQIAEDNTRAGWTFVVVVGVMGATAAAAGVTLRLSLPHYWYGLLPLNPRLAWRQSAMQFLRTWHMAAAGGLLADKSVALAARSVQHPRYRAELLAIAARVGAERRPPSEFLAPSGFLDQTELTQVVTMEKTGAVDETLERLANQATDRFARGLKLWVGFLVAGLIAAVILYVLYLVLMFALSYAGMIDSAIHVR